MLLWVYNRTGSKCLSFCHMPLFFHIVWSIHINAQSYDYPNIINLYSMTVLVPVKYSHTHFFTCQTCWTSLLSEFIKIYILWVLTEVTCWHERYICNIFLEIPTEKPSARLYNKFHWQNWKVAWHRLINWSEIVTKIVRNCTMNTIIVLEIWIYCLIALTNAFCEFLWILLDKILSAGWRYLEVCANAIFMLVWEVKFVRFIKWFNDFWKVWILNGFENFEFSTVFKHLNF